MPTLRTRVLIVDDHALVRAGFRQLLESTDDLEATGEAGTSAGALSQVDAGEFDVVLLDISLPDAGVMETVNALRRKHLVPILVVSMHPEEEYAVELLRAGVSGFSPRRETPRDAARHSLDCRRPKIHEFRVGAIIRNGHSRKIGDAGPSTALGPRISGLLATGGRQDGHRHRQGVAAERKDHQHLPHAHP